MAKKPLPRKTALLRKKNATVTRQRGRAKRLLPAAEHPAHADISEQSGERLLPDKADFFIVAIGASAGGLEAFQQFFSHMPVDSGMAFVLITHLDPTHKSILGDLLQRYTHMKVFQAEDGLIVRPDCLYLIPPNKDMSILHGALQLLDPAEGRGVRHPIDFFFRSLAEDQGMRSIGIVLSGTGTEGALGLKAVKGEGGLVLVQDPRTAKYDGMPSSAIATGLVDFVLSPDRMPDKLMSYIRRPALLPLLRPGKPPGTSDDLLQKIFILIRSQTGHDFSLYKHNTILRRIEKRMAIHQIERLADYVTLLRGNPQEVEALFKEFLIRVTNFFRDPDAFEVLKKTVLPSLMKNRPADDPLRVWVPGCSTGEEAYSLAILIGEYAKKLKKNFRVQIFATDIDHSAINAARSGVYEEGIADDVSPERLSRYFTKKGSLYKVRDDIREMAVFAVQNVIKDPPFSRLDLISCRNLLIYLGAALQKKVLPLFYYSLRPGGILFLGSSESIGEHEGLFTTFDKKSRIFKVKRPASAQLPPDMRPAAPRDLSVSKGKVLEQKTQGDPGMGGAVDHMLLEDYAPPCVIADEQGDILYFHGRTGTFLEPASGKARLNVFDMTREGMRLELRMGFRRALKQKKSVLFEGLQIRTNGRVHAVNVELKYITKPELLRGLILVLFHETHAKIGKQKKVKGLPGDSTKRHVAELELELKTTKEYLQSTIGQLETSNEELKSTNEELQSSNEELQSTNEEIETSKEELQSVNEELITVNAELQTKIDELSQANSDMNNLLTGTEIATIFLSDSLRIKRFTPTATDVINLIQTDVGRPISDIASKLDYQDMVRDAEDVLRNLASKDREVRGMNGRWFIVRIMPYRTVANVIDGVVVTFVDITAQKQAQQKLGDALGFADGIIETVREPLVVLDADLRVIRANGAFYRTFNVSSGMTEKKLIFELGNRQWNIPALRELLEKVLPENEQVRDFLVDHEFPGIGRRTMLLNAHRVATRDAKNSTILLAIEDITGRKQDHAE